MDGETIVTLDLWNVEGLESSGVVKVTETFGVTDEYLVSRLADGEGKSFSLAVAH